MTRFLFLLVLYFPSSSLWGMYVDHLKSPESTPIRVLPQRVQPQIIDLTSTSLSPATLKAVLSMIAEESQEENCDDNCLTQDFGEGTGHDMGLSTIKKQTSHRSDDSLFGEDIGDGTPVNVSWVTKRVVPQARSQESLNDSQGPSTTGSASYEPRVDLRDLLNDKTDGGLYEADLEESQYGYLDERASEHLQEESGSQMNVSSPQEHDTSADRDQPMVEPDSVFPLHEAISAGDMAKVLTLLATDADLGSKNALGQTAFFVAVRRGDKELCETLLIAGAEAQTQDVHGRTPLHEAASLGFADILTLLLGKVDIEARTLKGWTALHCACWNGQPEAAAILLTNSAQVDVRCDAGNTPLHFATWRDQEDISKLLIYCRASLSAENSCGATPFHYAAYRGNGKIVELILSQKADYSITTSMGNTPLHCAAWRGYVDVALFLLDQGAQLTLNRKGESPLHCAAHNGHVSVIEAFVERNMLEHTPSVWTLLHSAAAGNQASLIPYLMTLKGVSLEGRDFLGRTAYEIAVQRNHVEVVQALANSQVLPGTN